MALKQCSWDGCEELAAYGTRTKPSWCDQHITLILHQGGLEPLELFVSPTAYRMTRCLTCGCEAHYRLAYTLDKNPLGEPTCRACFWCSWTVDALRMGGSPVEAEAVSEETARALAEEHDFDYLGPAPIPPAHRVRCRFCHHVTAERLGDIAWGCSCQVNPKRAAITHSVYVADADEAGSPISRLNPELAEQWHPTKNLPMTLARVSPGSRKQFHWREPSCGHEWTASPAEREKRQRLRCTECRTILDSLAWHFPDLAAEWSGSNPLSAWHVRPSGTTPFVPEWICPSDPSHRWQMSAQVRVNGSTCPLCRESGKSMVELRYYEAIRSLFGEAFSGLAMRSDSFTHRSTWVPDVTVQLDDGRALLVEYDGGYWHAGKASVDTAKSQDLLSTGALVVRIRESPLPPLDLNSDCYLELTVSSARPDPAGTAAAIRAWLDQGPR